VVNLLGQIEAAEREAKLMLSEWVRAELFACPIAELLCFEGYLPLLDSINKSKIDAVSQLPALLAWTRCKV
jgi:hypothetical protein